MDGCVELANALVAGRGIKLDWERGAMLYDMACDRGNGQACALLATQHEKGAGVPRDPERATRLRRRACEQGFVEACVARKAAA
jgi:TPR repeat protein